MSPSVPRLAGALGAAAATVFVAACSGIAGSGGNAGSGDGATVTVRVRGLTIVAEVADSDTERRRGLMYRTDLPPGRGMIFEFAGETTSGFYMFRTLLPLSIMFVRDGRVVGVREMTPCPSDDPSSCPVYYPDGAYTHAVEAPARTFAEVVAGDPVAIGSD
ncbi:MULTISPECIES: DUF192 domain-containing protein [unclassified Frankia]|uniref:DUF192 domain-containing protein n=1 Tax=unclassified Frankia TaxID=2632575 RepID=UPI001F293CB8|nr:MULTISPECIES: DUF192 domain-containing protein [unclassified Frankia]